MAEKIQLPYTLETMFGMVRNASLPPLRAIPSGNGSNEYPPLENSPTVKIPLVYPASAGSYKQKWAHVGSGPDITCFRDFTECDWFSPEHSEITDTAIACIRQRRSPDKERLRGAINDIDRFVANVNACRNPGADMHQLMTFIKSRTHLDLEQAAAVVVSAFVNSGHEDDAALLLRELTGVLAVSNMSLQQWDLLSRRNTLAQGSAEAQANLAGRLYFWCRRAGATEATIGSSPPYTCEGLVHLLLRVRRARPASRSRCVYIPAWLFEAAGIAPPPHHAAYLNGYQAQLAAEGRQLEGIMGYRFPTAEPDAESIVLSKHGFRIVQRGVLALFRFWNAEVRLRREVRQLEDEVLYLSTWIDTRMRETDDVAEVAHWFFAYQRRLQNKVVSDDHWTRFLAKGEGATLYQNNLRMKSTFEDVLAKIAGIGSEAPGKGGDTLGLMDKTCLLMKEYVDVYGGGKKETLVFTQGVRGGKGRGSVDEYNVLCDVLQALRQRAKDEGIETVPGPVYKFLAKDIMHWNKSWEDDAFAGGKVHGWETWVKDRRLVSDADPRSPEKVPNDDMERMRLN